MNTTILFFALIMVAVIAATIYATKAFLGARDGVKDAGESPRPDVPATRQWVDDLLNAKLAPLYAKSPSMEGKDSYSGCVMYRGKRYQLTIDKSDLYGYGTLDGNRVEYDRRVCKISGEIWVNGKHIMQTRDASNVCEVVADIQAALASLEHLQGELQLQVRTDLRRYIHSGDIEAGWPSALSGNMTRSEGSLVKNFEMA